VTYPNLELLQYRFEQYLFNIRNHNKVEKPYYRGNTHIYVFPQTWPNTGGGFARKGAVYGQSMTQQYTTVVVNEGEQSALVCFDNDPAYWVSSLTKSFWNDLRHHSMAGVEDAFSRYDDEREDENDQL